MLPMADVHSHVPPNVLDRLYELIRFIRCISRAVISIIRNKTRKLLITVYQCIWCRSILSTCILLLCDFRQSMDLNVHILPRIQHE